MKTPTELFCEYVARKGGAIPAADALPIQSTTVYAVCAGTRAISTDVALAVEIDGGPRVEQLRPDLDWQRDADGVVTGYLVPVVARVAAAA